VFRGVSDYRGLSYTDPFGLCPETGDSFECFTLGPILVEARQPSHDGNYQRLANWGAQRGGTLGTIALNGGAALNALAEAGDRILGGTTCDGGVCALGAPSVGPGAIFTRFGKGAESVTRLATQAANAEARIGIHGVSVRLGASTTRPGATATREALESAGFPLTQTGLDPHHFTAALPKPVTKAIARAWNTVWGWR
jgi:hypothetical protein